MITRKTAAHHPGADVVVVGAGISGLAAAHELACRGREILVLEARDRLGGRIDSRPSTAGAVAELGAQVVHGTENPVLALLGSPSGAVTLGGADLSADLVTPDGDVRAFANSDGFLSPPALVGPMQAIRRALGPQMAQRLTLEMALTTMRVPQESAHALYGWVEQITGADPRQISVERFCTDAVFALGDDAEFTVPSGLATLVTPLAERVTVHTGHQVRQVGREADGVRVSFEAPDGTVHSMLAGSVILTVPPPVIGSGRLVVEDLPPSQLDAARSLALVPAVAAAVPLDQPAARDAFRCDLADGCGFMTWMAGRRHVSVVAKASAAPRLRTLLTEDPSRLRSLVEGAVPGTVTRDSPVQWHDWAADPLATGAFTAPLPGAAGLAETWRTPVAGRIHFAGEAALAGPTSPFLDRAYASGLRASTEIQRLTEGVTA